MDNLQRARGEINKIDREMAALFERRMKAVEEVAAFKQSHGIPVFDSAREKAVVEQNTALLTFPEYRDSYVDFITHLMELSKQRQRFLLGSDTAGYQGAEGAYSHIMLRKLFPHRNERAFPTFRELTAAVAAGEISCGVLPIENSYAGEVGEVLDLLYEYDVHVSGLHDLRIRHTLVGVKGARLSEIKQVYSKDQALSQCGCFLEQLGAQTIPYPNTALAAKYVSETGDSSKAAVASPETAQLYGLDILKEEIATGPENTTRFIVISKELPKEGNRFSVIFTLAHHTGTLAGAMGTIARHGFNMECIRSKPVHELPWQYYFYVELVGNAFSEEGKRMLEELQGSCKELKLLGVYSAK